MNAPPATIDRDQLASRVRALPALPQAALDALAALRDEDSSAEHCGALLGRDQAIAARVLKLANSAFYGVPGRVGSVRDAVLLLGRRPLVSVLTVAAMSGQFDPKRCPGFDFAGFWRHAIGVALTTRALARFGGEDQDLAFTTGLLHDIGRLVLATQFNSAYAGVAEALARHDDPVSAEREVLGTDHVEAGALVAAHWRFPAPVVAALLGHHAPTAADDGKASLADLLHVADAAVHALDLAGAEAESVPLVDAASWQRAGVPDKEWLAIFAATESGVATLAAALGLA